MALEQIGVEATIQGLSSFRRGIGNMNDDVRGFGRTTDGLLPGLNSMGDSLLKVGGIAAGAVVAGFAAATAAVGAFTVGGIKSAIEFEDQMGSIAAIMNTTKSEIEPLSDFILNLAIDPNLKVSAQEAANAVELLARNGLTMTEIMNGAARSTVLLANATGAEFGNAADIATDAMAIFNIKAEDMAGAVDSIVSVTTNSKFTIDDFSLAIRNGGAAAAMMNVSLEDFNTVIAATAEEMGSGMRAGTGFRNFITRLTPATEGATQAMMDLGLVTSAGTNMFFDANGQLKDMADVSLILNKALYGTSTAITEVGGRTSEQNAELQRLQGIYARTVTSINDYELGIKGAGLTEEARARKLEELNLVLQNTSAAMGPLNAIQGELIETTKTLTDAERSAALELIFGQDALGTAIGLGNEGVVVYTDLATAMEETGLSQEALSGAMEDGVITAFELLQAAMGETDAAKMAIENMDDVAGVMGIVGDLIGGLQLKIGNMFLPAIKDMGQAFADFLNNIGPDVLTIFESIGGILSDIFNVDPSGFTSSLGGIETFIGALADGLSVIDRTGNVIAGVNTAMRTLGIPEDTRVQVVEFMHSVQDMVDSVSEFVTEHSDEFKGALIGIGAVLASGVIVSVLGTIAGIVAALVSPIGLLVIGFAALGAAISHFGGIQQIMENIRTFIETTDFAALGQQLINQLLEGASNFGEVFGVWAGNLLVQITGAINAIDWTMVGQQVMTFIGNAIAAYIGFQVLIGQTIYNFFSSGLESQDWLTIGTNILTAIFNALNSFGEGVGIVLAGWYESFIAWVQSVDWGAIGLSILNFVLTGLANFGVFVGETLAGWYSSFVTWLDGIDWVQIGIDIILFIISGLANFGALVAETLTLWANAYFDWVDTIDWEQIGYDIVFGVIDGLLTFGEEIGKTLAEWYESFTTWQEDKDWEEIAADIIIDIVKKLQDFWAEAEPKIDAWWTSIKAWFDKMDWASLGQSIIDGVVGAIEKGVGSVTGAIRGLIQGGINAAQDALKSHSPSRVFYDFGLSIGQGLILGVNKTAASVHDSILALFDVGRDLGSVGSSFANQFKNAVLPEMEKSVEDAQRTVDILKERFVTDFGVTLGIAGLTNEQESELKRLQNMYDKTAASIRDYESGIKGADLSQAELSKKITELNNELLSIQNVMNPLAQMQERAEQPFTDRDLVSAYFQAIHSGNMQMKRDIETIWQAQNQLGAATAEYKKAQEDIVALQKAQADLAFIEQQQKLLDMIAEHGLNASDILGGLELGLGADTQGLVQAMTRAIQAIIEQAETQLGVASPSRVFKEIGGFITGGLAQGIMSTIGNPAMAMESMLNQMVQPMQSQAAMPSVINQPSTTTVSKTAQVQFGDVSVGSDMDVQVLGDFIVQKIAEAI